MFITICLLAAIYLVGTTFLYRKSNGKIEFCLDNIFLLAFQAWVCIVYPVSYLLSSRGMNSEENSASILDITAGGVFLYYLSAFIILFTVLTCLRRKKRYDDLRLTITLDKKENDANDSGYFWIASAVFLIGVVCDVLYLRVYGGYMNYLQYVNDLRSGVAELYNPLSFLITFRNCVYFASFLYFALMFKNHKLVFSRFVLFIASFVYSLFILYSNKGRLGFVLYLCTFLVYFLYAKGFLKTINFKMFLKAIPLLALFVGLLAVSNVVLDRGTNTNFIASFNREISFPFVNFETIVFKSGVNRYFIDTLLWPIFVLPSRIWDSMFGIRTASAMMTLYTAGGFKGEEGIYGEMPIDLISVSYIQLGIVGVFAFALVWAMIIRWLFRWINKNVRHTKVNMVLKVYVLITVMLQSILYADPKHIVQRCFALIVFVIVHIFFAKFVAKKHKKKVTPQDENEEEAPAK